MKILCYYALDWERDFFIKNLPSDTITFVKGNTREFSVIKNKESEVLCVFVDSPVNKALLDQLPHLKLIVTRSTGYDNIDLQEAQRRHITVCSVPAYGKTAVAEYTMGLMLNLSRQITQACDAVRQNRFCVHGWCGIDLCGKTLGIIGTGSIGSRVAELAKAFGMNIIACDVQPNQALAEQIGFTYVTFEQLLAQSDVVTLHVLYNESTHHLVNCDTITQMKRGSYLINTARGAVVQTQALVKGLCEGILAGVALDVLEQEGYMSDMVPLLLEKNPQAHALQTVLANQYLMHHSCVLMTQHNAFNSQEACTVGWQVSCENIKAFVAGKPMNVVA